MLGRENPDRPRIKGIASMATREMLAQLVTAYQQVSAQAVVIESTGGVAAFQRVRDGAPFDFVVLAADAIDRLDAAGRLVRDSRVDIARSTVSVAVAQGAPRPDIGSEAAVRDAVLSAGSIGYSTGPSGAHLSGLFMRWGIADAIASRVVQAPPGVPVGALVARGDVALGFQQSSELLHVPGIDIIGTLPSEIQIITVFAAAICEMSAKQEAARALLTFLRSSAADAARFEHGMLTP